VQILAHHGIGKIRPDEAPRDREDPSYVVARAERGLGAWIFYCRLQRGRLVKKGVFGDNQGERAILDKSRIHPSVVGSDVGDAER